MPITTVTSVSASTKNENGGEMRILLSPKTVDSSSGFMGTLSLLPGEVFDTHYHPYSDEYIYVVRGQVSITDENTTTLASSGTGIFVPQNVAHCLQNSGITLAVLVFFSTPLAPHSELGHVLLEPARSQHWD